MQKQRPSLTRMAFEDLGESGARRKRFVQLVFESGVIQFDTRRRANGRICQYGNPDDNHRLPADLLWDAVEACDGATSWLDELNLHAAACRARKASRVMRVVRHSDEQQDRRHG